MSEDIKMTEEEIAALEIKKAEQRVWRNQQLKDTDWIITIHDHPEKVSHWEYRQLLRDWTDTPDFPDTRPTLL